METLFNQIQQLVADKIEWLDRNVDEDYGQLEMLYRDDEDSDTYPLTFPLVLIDIPETSWTTMGGAFSKVQSGTGNVNDTHFTSGTADKAQERADKVHELHSLLQGWMPMHSSSPLDRKTSRSQTMTKGIKVYELNYECRMIDDATQV